MALQANAPHKKVCTDSRLKQANQGELGAIMRLHVWAYGCGEGEGARGGVRGFVCVAHSHSVGVVCTCECGSACLHGSF